MRRVLFVDDDPETRRVYGHLQDYWPQGFETHTAESTSEALHLMGQGRFDVVVSDLNMPDRPGLDFLKEITELHPSVARIVVSGHADHLKAAEALNVAHRYFSKPLNLDVLGALLKQLCQYHYLLHTERIQRMIFSTGALPVLPATWGKLAELLNSPEADINDIAAIVEEDPGLTSKLLHTVNSAYFGMPRKVVSPAEAIQIVGLELLRGLMMGMKVFEFYQSRPLVRSVFSNIWEHSLRTATGARKIAATEHQTLEACNLAFTAGLLHDVGKLVLAANAERDYRVVLDLSNKSAVPLEAAELGIFGCTHADIGAFLFALWGFPDAVIQAVANHHRLEGIKNFTPALAIHVAQCLQPLSRQRDRLDTRLLQKLELEERMPVWEAVLNASLEKKAARSLKAHERAADR